jgi:hypothetical protein
MSKKGQFELRKMIYWTIAIIVITIVIFAFVMILSQYQGNLTKVPPRLKAELISLRFVNAPECFAYRDEIKVYPGVIDMDKFNEERLSGCYQSGSTQNFNFQLVLEDKTLETDEWFNAVSDTLYKEVLIKGEEMRKATLIIYVQEKI